jgi:hypothetical protein
MPGPLKKILTATIMALATSLSIAQTKRAPETVNTLIREVQSGRIAYKLTEAGEIFDLLGKPAEQDTGQPFGE